MLAGDSTHESTFPYGRKSYKAHASYAGSGDVEASYQRGISVLFPDLGNRDTLHPPPPPLDDGVKSSRLSFASFAFS